MLRFNGGTIGIANTVFTGTKSDDPNYSNVSLLLNGNGTNSSTTFTDSSSYAHTVTAIGNAQISTTQSKFGGASIYLDGSGDCLSLPDNASAFDFGTGDFTIECWIYWVGGEYGIVFSQRHAYGINNTGMSWRIDDSNDNIGFWHGDGLDAFATPNYAISKNTWTHIALTRNGSTFTIWVNGQSEATNTITASMIYYPPVIGRAQGVLYEYLNAYLDEYRITKGVARYTSNFTPPTAELPGAETGTFASGLWTSSDHIKQIRNELWPGFVPSIVTDGLVLHLDAGDSASYPGSGTTWTDLSGNGNNGTLVNGVGYNSANLGSLSFDGVNDVVNSTTSIIDRADGQEITVSCWIKPSRTSGQYSIFCSNRSDNLAIYNWIFYQHITDGAIAFHGDAQNKSSYVPTTNVWINVTNTVTASGVSTLYVNGVSTYTVTGYTYGNGTPSRLGIGAYPGGQEPFQGNIAQVTIYNKALTSSEITQNFDVLKGRYGL